MSHCLIHLLGFFLLYFARVSYSLCCDDMFTQRGGFEMSWHTNDVNVEMIPFCLFGASRIRYFPLHCFLPHEKSKSWGEIPSLNRSININNLLYFSCGACFFCQCFCLCYLKKPHPFRLIYIDEQSFSLDSQSSFLRDSRSWLLVSLNLSIMSLE